MAAVMTAANTAAKPLDDPRRGLTAVECPPSVRTAADASGRPAHSYGSEGWGFESLRAPRPPSAQVRGPLPDPEGAFLLLLAATLGATGTSQPPNRARLIDSGRRARALWTVPPDSTGMTRPIFQTGHAPHQDRPVISPSQYWA
jgi:hypothetical protein